MALYIIDLPGHRNAHRLYHAFYNSTCNHDCLYYEQNEPMDPMKFIAEGRRGPDEPDSAEQVMRRSASLQRAIDEGRSWKEGDEDHA